jgi:hypothetical protein
MDRCKKCGKFIKATGVYQDGQDTYCGDCALNVIVTKYGCNNDTAYRILEMYQFGN